MPSVLRAVIGSPPGPPPRARVKSVSDGADEGVACTKLRGYARVMDSALSGVFAGIFGLVGVVVGGVTTRQQAERTYAREREKADSEQERVIRAASRLVVGEMRDVMEGADFADDMQQWWDDEELPTLVWRERRELLAANLSQEEWDVVDKAYFKVAALNRAKREAKATSPGALTQQGKVALADAMPRLNAAIALLEKYQPAVAGAPTPTGTRRRRWLAWFPRVRVESRRGRPPPGGASG
jgi:hypothetical protein